MRADAVGLYVHIPFCISKCAYCDFCSYVFADMSITEAYVNRLCEEIASYKRQSKVKVNTVFFGGGTPSVLRPELFCRIVDSIKDAFDISALVEFTVEVNPKTLTHEKLDAFIGCGVNRISIGLQSIHENELKKLGRIHDYSDFLETYSLCRECGISNINVDLMYGIPDQTGESFSETLKQVLLLSPEHLSVYSLIVEEGTPLADNIDAYSIPDDDAVCDMYDGCCDLLSANGYSHYEISNYAKEGFECRHNLKYWNADEYIGVGLAAHSYFEGVRYSCDADKDSIDLLHSYISGEYSAIKGAVQSKEDEIYEYVMLRLRLSYGVIFDEFFERFGFDFRQGRKAKLEDLAKAGFADYDDKAFRLTERGFFISNAILVDLL